MIRTAILAKYRVHEFIQFMSNVLAIVKRHDPEKLQIGAFYTALLQHNENLLDTYKQDTNSKITPQLEHLDHLRDQAIICLRKVCDGYAHHHNELLSAAGEKIVACIDKHGTKLYHLNYGAETAVLRKLAGELQTKPEYVSALRALHLEEVVRQMEVANTSFEELFIQRLEAFSQDETKSTREMVQLASEAYRTLVQHIEARALLAPAGEYTPLIAHINENVEYFNLIVERRRNGEAVEEAEATPEAAEALPAASDAPAA